MMFFCQLIQPTDLCNSMTNRVSLVGVTAALVGRVSLVEVMVAVGQGQCQ